MINVRNVIQFRQIQRTELLIIVFKMIEQVSMNLSSTQMDSVYVAQEFGDHVG